MFSLPTTVYMSNTDTALTKRWLVDAGSTKAELFLSVVSLRQEALGEVRERSLNTEKVHRDFKTIMRSRPIYVSRQRAAVCLKELMHQLSADSTH